MLPYITSFNTLNCHKCVSLSLSWYLHLSEWNHKYNHFPNVGSLFCQLFQNATVPLHFRCMNKWKAINMSLSLHSGSLHCVSMRRTVCSLGSRFWCPICKATKMFHHVHEQKEKEKVSFWKFTFCSCCLKAVQWKERSSWSGFHWSASNLSQIFHLNKSVWCKHVHWCSSDCTFWNTPRWSDLFFGTVCLKITLQLDTNIFFLLSIATPQTRLEGKLISLLGCCLINFLYEGCPVWSLWCLPPVHSWFEI